MITRVQVKNFRSLADVNVELNRLTVFVGRNGAGKSAFMDALRFVRDALRQGLEEAVKDRRGLKQLRRWMPDGQGEIEISLTVEGTSDKGETLWGEYSFSIVSEPNGDYRVCREQGQIGDSSMAIRGAIRGKFEINDGKWVTQPFGHNGSPAPTLPGGGLPFTLPSPNRSLVLPSLRVFSPLFVLLSDLITGGFYEIAPHRLRLPQQPLPDELLSDSGDNFASILKRLCQNEEWKRGILPPLARVAEGVSDVRVQQVGDYLVTQLKHEDVVNDSRQDVASPWFELSQESDGTLRFLGILVALHQEWLPSSLLLAVEEPETSIHPGALAVLSDELREAAIRHQILLTTQSPDLISRFSVDELRVVERGGGVTRIGPVDEVQRESIEEQLFSAGDILRIEGLRREPTGMMEGVRA